MGSVCFIQPGGSASRAGKIRFQRPRGRGDVRVGPAEAGAAQAGVRVIKTAGDCPQTRRVRAAETAGEKVLQQLTFNSIAQEVPFVYKNFSL